MTGGMGAAGTSGARSWGPLQWTGVVLLWLWVLVPFGYGVVQLILRIPALFAS
jgi:hypothetical protein